jgi:hypothetical protein
LAQHHNTLFKGNFNKILFFFRSKKYCSDMQEKWGSESSDMLTCMKPHQPSSRPKACAPHREWHYSRCRLTFQLARLEDNGPWTLKFITLYPHSGGAVLQVHTGICAIFGLDLKVHIVSRGVELNGHRLVVAHSTCCITVRLCTNQ